MRESRARERTAPKEQSSPTISQVRVPHRTGHSEKQSSVRTSLSPTVKAATAATVEVKLSGRMTEGEFFTRQRFALGVHPSGDGRRTENS
jgi:hypothetical protein